MEDMDSLKQFLTIQQVSQKLDVPKPTLRFWEKEFEGILVPLRTNGRQRRYAPEHVAVIKEIKLLKKAGLSLIEIKRKMGKGIDDSLIGRFDDWGKGRDGGQISEAGSQTCPQCSRLRGGRGFGMNERMGLIFWLREWRRLLRWRSCGFFRGEKDKPLRNLTCLYYSDNVCKLLMTLPAFFPGGVFACHDDRLQ